MTQADEPTTERATPQDERLTTSAIAEAGKPEEARPSETRTFAGEGSSAADTGRRDADAAAPLFPGDEAKDLHARWDTIQAGFVDEPRQVVEQADELVATTMKRLEEIFAAERDKLEQQWARGDDVSTEDLRVALRRYRSFFGRLLSM